MPHSTDVYMDSFLLVAKRKVFTQQNLEYTFAIETKKMLCFVCVYFDYYFHEYIYYHEACDMGE